MRIDSFFCIFFITMLYKGRKKIVLQFTSRFLCYYITDKLRAGVYKENQVEKKGRGKKGRQGKGKKEEIGMGQGRVGKEIKIVATLCNPGRVERRLE